MADDTQLIMLQAKKIAELMKDVDNLKERLEVLINTNEEVKMRNEELKTQENKSELENEELRAAMGILQKLLKASAVARDDEDDLVEEVVAVVRPWSLSLVQRCCPALAHGTTQSADPAHPPLIPDFPAVPGNSVIPGTPDVPAVPDAPGVPVVPGVPDIPVNPAPVVPTPIPDVSNPIPEFVPDAIPPSSLAELAQISNSQAHIPPDLGPFLGAPFTIGATQFPTPAIPALISHALSQIPGNTYPIPGIQAPFTAVPSSFATTALSPFQANSVPASSTSSTSSLGITPAHTPTATLASTNTACSQSSNASSSQITLDPLVTQKRSKALLESAMVGRVKGICRLLKKGADIAFKDSTDRCPLHWTAINGHSNVAAVLISCGASVDVQDNIGFTPLHYAASGGHQEICTALLKAGALVDVRSRLGSTALHWAAAYGSHECVEVLIAAGAYINVTNNDGETPLHWSAICGYEKCSRVLIDAGADANVRNNRGKTAKDWAKDSNILKLLG